MGVFALLTGLLLLGIVAADEVLQDEDSRCNFFCTLQPHPQRPITIESYRNLSCTHLIYGPAEINARFEIKTPSTYDLTEPSTVGNYDKLREWRSFKNPIKKIYLGVYSDRQMHMLSNEWTQSVVTKNLLEHLRLHRFDGFLLFTDGTETWTRSMKNFLVHFREQEKANNQTVEIFLSLPARLIGTARPILRDLEPLINGLYLNTDDISATENPNIAVSVDPLHPNPPNVPDVDAISENTGQLVYNGFPEDKIVVGLSSWARGYMLPPGETEGHHGSRITGVVKGGPSTKRRDGKLAYREICLWTNDNPVTYDNVTETQSLVRDNAWYSVVLPHQTALKNKVKWIAAQNFMGIGLSSLFSDDQTNHCGQGEWPLHTTISNEYKCKIRRKKQELKGSCTRMCSFQPSEGEKFDYKNFESQWCSHIIILAADILAVGGVRLGTTVIANIEAFDKWNVKTKPLLILSVGDMQEKDTWRMSIGQPMRRTVTVRSIQQAVNQYDLDGVDISWTLSSPETVWDANNLAQFLAELRLAIPNKQLIVSVTPQFSYNSHIKGENIGQLVDYFLLQGYKFHAYNHIFTGHHSPLFISSELLADPKMTIEGLSFDWVSRGVPSSKLIIGFSAAGMSMLFQNVRSGNEIGAPANVFLNTQPTRAGNAGSMSQSEICKILQDNQTKSVFIEELGIPYATRNDEFIAYDNARSMQVKAIWASLNNFGGIGLHAIEMDNIHGECPQGRPYPLLQTLIKAQVCDYCVRDQSKKSKEAPKQKCEPDFQVACSYRLPKGEKVLNPEKIPFGQCTEIVIEEAGLTSSGKVGFAEEKADENVKALIKANSENDTKPLIASIQCQMKGTELTNLLEDPSTAVLEIDAFVKKYQLHGVEIKCDSIITAQNKDLYTKFLKELKSTLNEGHTGSCPVTVSIRIPVYNLRLNETYNIETLNSLHHVSLESFQTSTTESQLVSPLFSVPNDEQTAVDTTISHWLNQGLRREVLLMHIPGYGIIQQLLSQEVRKEQHEVGETVKENFFQTVTQKDICAKLDEQSQNKLIYDYIAAYTITPTNEWISYETQATITYKMKYAIREGLAGIGLMSLNDDDDEGICKQGAFPLLHAITRNVCPAT